MSLEKLKLLTTKSTNVERGSFAYNALTWEDVAGAISRARPIASLYARLIYTNDKDAIRKLEREMLQQILYDKETQGWNVRVGTLRLMVRLAICEHYLGRPIPVADDNYPADKLRLLKVSRNEWYRQWAEKYRYIWTEFYRWDSHLASILKDQLTSDKPW